MTDSTRIEHYFSALREGYEVMADAVKDASARGTQASERLLAEIEAGQRDALALAEKVAANPSNAAENYTSTLETALAAQDRALAFAQQLYSRAGDAGEEGRATFEKIFSAGRSISEAAVELSRDWMHDSTWNDAWRQGFDAMNAAAAAMPNAAGPQGGNSAASAN